MPARMLAGGRHGGGADGSGVAGGLTGAPRPVSKRNPRRYWQPVRAWEPGRCGACDDAPARCCRQPRGAARPRARVSRGPGWRVRAEDSARVCGRGRGGAGRGGAGRGESRCRSGGRSWGWRWWRSGWTAASPAATPPPAPPSPGSGSAPSTPPRFPAPRRPRPAGTDAAQACPPARLGTARHRWLAARPVLVCAQRRRCEYVGRLVRAFVAQHSGRGVAGAWLGWAGGAGGVRVDRGQDGPRLPRRQGSPGWQPPPPP